MNPSRALTLIGVDPGLGASHAVALTCEGRGRPFRVLGTLTVRTPTDPAALPHEDDWNVEQLALRNPDAVLVEVARGAVASGRDADYVLQNNIVAGRLLGALTASGLVAVPVASGGDAAGWNWRGELNIRGSGAAARDAATEMTVEGLLGQPLPRGPKGGKLTHWQDAAGVALAGFSRAHAHPTLSAVDALCRLSVMDELVLAGRKRRKSARKAARTGIREWTS